MQQVYTCNIFRELNCDQTITVSWDEPLENPVSSSEVWKLGFVTHGYRVFYCHKKSVAGRMQIKDRNTTLIQLSVNFNVNKVVASSEHES